MIRNARPLVLTALLTLIASSGCTGPKTPDGDDSIPVTDTTHTGDDSFQESLPDDSSSSSGSCGWDQDGEPPGYYCGFSDEEPTGTYPMACPDGLVEGDACGSLGGEGCCDANGDNWYCGQDGDQTYIVFEDCP